ncbi:MAG: peroxiredoxin [Candidatus Didemnitutus sp.]|nr:peroxiredoxin [Candidatus Didemnitutus sp.]
MKPVRCVALLATMLFSLHASAEPLKVGDSAPAVTGTTDAGVPLNFAETYKQGYTLVYFYPKADTPGCTAQGCSLRDAYAELGRKGVTVIGVSADDVEAQKKFREKYNLPFTLIADAEKVVITAFGVPTRDIPLVGSFASRQAFLINKEGKIVWADFKASTAKQAEDVLAALKSLGE